MRYRLITGLGRSDQERYPDMKDFDSALNDAVIQFYIPIFTTFRVTRIEGNVMFSIITESITEPAFIGGKH